MSAPEEDAQILPPKFNMQSHRKTTRFVIASRLSANAHRDNHPEKAVALPIPQILQSRRTEPAPREPRGMARPAFPRMRFVQQVRVGTGYVAPSLHARQGKFFALVRAWKTARSPTHKRMQRSRTCKARAATATMPAGKVLALRNACKQMGTIKTFLPSIECSGRPPLRNAAHLCLFQTRYRYVSRRFKSQGSRSYHSHPCRIRIELARSLSGFFKG